LEENLGFLGRMPVGWVRDFRTDRSHISEQNGLGFGSRFSELGRWRAMAELGKEAGKE